MKIQHRAAPTLQVSLGGGMTQPVMRLRQKTPFKRKFTTKLEGFLGFDKMIKDEKWSYVCERVRGGGGGGELPKLGVGSKTGRLGSVGVCLSYSHVFMLMHAEWRALINGLALN